MTYEDYTLVCGYCGQTILDSYYIYTFFPEEKVHKPVHNIHLKGGRKELDEQQNTNN